MKYHVYKDSQGYYRWRLKASNYKIIADSAEGYNNKADCLTSMALVMDTNRNTPWVDET